MEEKSRQDEEKQAKLGLIEVEKIQAEAKVRAIIFKEVQKLVKQNWSAAIKAYVLAEKEEIKLDQQLTVALIAFNKKVEARKSKVKEVEEIEEAERTSSDDEEEAKVADTSDDEEEAVETEPIRSKPEAVEAVTSDDEEEAEAADTSDDEADLVEAAMETAQIKLAEELRLQKELDMTKTP